MLSVQEIGDIAAPIARKVGVSELYLFGSQAKGTATSSSDIDFIYDFPENLSMSERAQNSRVLRAKLREAFGTDVDMIRKTYLTEKKSDPMSELMRVAFVSDLNTYTVYRIV